MEGIPAQAFYLEGLSLLRLGRRDEGIQALGNCLIIDSEHALSHYNLAVALFSGGDPQQAKYHLDAAIANGTTPHPQFAADLEAALALAAKPE